MSTATDDDEPTPGKPQPNRNPRRDSARLSSVTTAIHLLKAFGEDDDELGISELAKRLGVAKSTVHRLASALLSEGFLQQNPETGRYRLGVGLFMLGSMVRARLDVTTEARAALNELREKTGENVRLAVLERNGVILLHDLEGPQSVRLRSATGQMRPFYCTAEGLVLLSGQRDADLKRLLAQPRSQRTPRTIVDEEALRAEIRQVKRQGYAIEDETFDLGTRCIAAPIYNGEGRLVAALGMAGPRTRVRRSQFAKLAQLVVAAADQVSARLGATKPQKIYI